MIRRCLLLFVPLSLLAACNTTANPDGPLAADDRLMLTDALMANFLGNLNISVPSDRDRGIYSTCRVEVLNEMIEDDYASQHYLYATQVVGRNPIVNYRAREVFYGLVFSGTSRGQPEFTDPVEACYSENIEN